MTILTVKVFLNLKMIAMKNLEKVSALLLKKDPPSFCYILDSPSKGVK